MRPSRAASRDLADRLVLEYAGAVPPGQVLALVFRTAQLLAAVPALTPELHTQMCEAAVRRALTDRLGSGRPRVA